MESMSVGRIEFGPYSGKHRPLNSPPINQSKSGTYFNLRREVQEVWGRSELPIEVSVVGFTFNGRVSSEHLAPRVQAALEELGAAIIEAVDRK